MPPEQYRQPSISLERVAVIIPAYNAGPSVAALVRELCDLSFGALVIVDDGSAPEHHAWIEEACIEGRSHLLRQEKNLGKGRALKTGFAFVEKALPEADVIVTADADGQHRAQDIARVAAAALGRPGEIVLGSRSLVRGVPWKSWLGNGMTRGLFRVVTGVPLQDTQTGLRAFPRDLLAIVGAIRGERYEYETAVLLHVCSQLGAPVEVPIQTVYLQANRGTHFRPVRDSWRIYRALAASAVLGLLRRKAFRANA
jgi:glycosyltransferase involved in cell wall biosynthesis